MVNRRASDAVPPTTPIAPVVKRKRRASCLGEQERRDRKRAIDREAQRSLREKTKTHIAELERTIQILRDQDRNGATSSLLSEIDGLRAENERLRDVIDSVKSVVGSEIFPRNNGGGSNAQAVKSDGGLPDGNSGGQQSPSLQPDSKPQTTSPHAIAASEHTSHYDSHNFGYHVPTSSRTLDLDGMTVMTDLVPLNSQSASNFDLNTVSEIPEDRSLLEAADSPTTAAFAPFMDEIFGSSYFCPSPVVLHIGDPPRVPSPTGISNKALCPIWKRSNELFEQVFSYRPNAKSPNVDSIEAGLLYLGIKEGWNTFSEWTHSPALKILKSVDEYLFCHLPRMERLAVAYKSFKLLRYYLNATKSELENVPPWLRPSAAQARTRHPVAVDFFAWPTLRSRLMDQHTSIFKTSDLSHSYSRYLRFDWPFSFEDAFFFDDMTHSYHPSPLFERYHRDLKYWKVSREFSEKCPDMWRDIESDRRKYSEEAGT